MHLYDPIDVWTLNSGIGISATTVSQHDGGLGQGNNH